MIKRIFGSPAFFAVAAVLIIGIGITFLMPPSLVRDAPAVPAAEIASVPGDTYELPENFRNVFTFCDRGHRIYVTAKDYGASSSSIAIVPNDPSCRPVPNVDEHG